MRLDESVSVSGIVTLLFTDVEGSTKLWESQPREMREALELHDQIALNCIAEHGGVLVKSRGEGDSLFTYFSSPTQAIMAAVSLQRLFANADWPPEAPIKVRIGIHSGDVLYRDRDLYGPTVNRAARIRSSAHGGQIIVSESVEKLATASELVDLEFRSLGRVRLKDLLQPELVSQICAPGLEENFPPLKTVDRTPNNLPIQIQSYVGREEDVARVGSLLETRRIVTLIGTGGCGKTRLALQAAVESFELGRSGIIFVDLTPCTVSQVESMIHQAMDSVLGAESTKSLPARCGSRELLIILDNCEHVIEEAAARAAELVRLTTGVKIIAASREALQIGGELTYRVGSLALPSENPSFDECLKSEAVQLFVERASERHPGFRLTESNALDIAAICQEIDGIPLAIEHAAGQIGSMSPSEMRERLEDKFRFLRTRDRGVVSRHATIRATLDWSYEMLNDEERRLLPVLSIFRTGWDMRTCSAVAEALGFTKSTAEDALEGLLSKSLVSLEGELSDSRRFKLLQTIKAYGAEKLDSGTRDSALSKLFDHYVGLVMVNDDSNIGRWISTDLPNIELVVAWACESGVARTIDLLFPMRNGLRRGGHAKRGTAMFSSILKAGLSEEPSQLAKTYNALGLLLWNQDLFHEAEAAYQKSGDFYEILDDQSNVIGIEVNLAIINAELGRNGRAIHLFERALVSYEGQGNLQRVGQVHGNLALVKLNAGDTRGALESFEKVKSFGHQNPNLRATFLKSYALALILNDQVDEAEIKMREAFEIWTDFEDVPALSGAVIAVVYMGMAEKPTAREGRLLGGSRAIEELTGSYCSVVERSLFETAKKALIESIGLAAADLAILEGEKLSVNQLTILAGQKLKELASQKSQSVAIEST